MQRTSDAEAPAAIAQSVSTCEVEEQLSPSGTCSNDVSGEEEESPSGTCSTKEIEE
jgi:hypothetical protein